MWRVMALAGVLAAVLAGPASAGESCHAPRAPMAVDGATASQAQLKRAFGRIRTFLKRSDYYQDCLFQKLNLLRSFARRGQIMLDPSIADATDAKIAANQALKEKAGTGYNAAVFAFHRRCAADPAARGCPVRPPSAVER